MKRPGKILGIALGPAGALIAEVAANGKRKVIRLAEFAYPAGIGIEQPAVLGKALAAYLKQEGISERDTVIGLPAKWLVTRRKELPPATGAVAAESLRLQAETEFSNERDIVVDYAGEAKTSAATSVLLVATAQTYVDNCVGLARAAGLRLHAITATGAALARATAAVAGAPGVLVSVSSAGVELVAHHDGDATHLRHLTASDLADAGPLAGEIRRALVGVPQNGTQPGMSLWHRNGDDLGEVLRQRLAIPVTSQPLRALATSDRPNAAGDGRFAPAVAVAAAGMEGAPVDFLHSRLAPPAPKSKKRLVLWGTLIAIVVIGTIVAAMVDLNRKETELQNLQTRIRAATPGAERDKLAEKRLRLARSFGTMSPRYDACFRDLTAMFPDDGRIWATSLKLSEPPRDSKADAKADARAAAADIIRGDLSCNFRDLAVGDALLQKIQQTKHFHDVKLNTRRQIPTTGEWTQSVTFEYRP